MTDYAKWAKFAQNVDDENGTSDEETKMDSHFELPSKKIRHSSKSLKEDLKTTSQQKNEMKERIQQYDELDQVLERLPEKMEHEVMIPITKKAFVPGKIVRGNEILAHLGDKNYAWQTSQQARAIASRQKEQLENQVKSMDEEIQFMSSKMKSIETVLKLQKDHDQKNEDIVDIREEYNEEEKSSVTTATQGSSSNAFDEKDEKEYIEITSEEDRFTDEEFSWEKMDDKLLALEKAEEKEVSLGEVTRNVAEMNLHNQSSAEALKAKGNLLFSKQNFKQALELYSQAIKIKADAYALYGNRSSCHYRLKHYQESLEDAEASIALRPTYAKGYYRKAMAHQAMEQHDMATKAFKKSAELCPNDSILKQHSLNKQISIPEPASSSIPAPLPISSASAFSDRIIENYNTSAAAAAANGVAVEKEAQMIEHEGEERPAPRRVSRFKAKREASRHGNM